MADWVTGKVTKVQNWTDALFSLTVHAPVLPFTAGQFTKLGLEIDGERIFPGQKINCRCRMRPVVASFSASVRGRV